MRYGLVYHYIVGGFEYASALKLSGPVCVANTETSAGTFTMRLISLN